MVFTRRTVLSVILLALTGCATHKSPEMVGNLHKPLDPESFYLPNTDAARIVTVTTNGVALANVLVQTHRAAVNETGPKETIEKFGEVYAFSPNFFAVHREEPTKIRFWNLQPDDNHDFMLIDPHSRVLMSVLLPPLKETAYVFTFHEEGLFNFVCAMHPPAMAGQILVLPPKSP
jgi:plastocyanin